MGTHHPVNKVRECGSKGIGNLFRALSSILPKVYWLIGAINAKGAHKQDTRSHHIDFFNDVDLGFGTLTRDRFKSRQCSVNSLFGDLY